MDDADRKRLLDPWMCRIRRSSLSRKNYGGTEGDKTRDH
jgi:hypothetical protein